jgi:hypothetical protein
LLLGFRRELIALARFETAGQKVALIIAIDAHRSAGGRRQRFDANEDIFGGPTQRIDDTASYGIGSRRGRLAPGAAFGHARF